MTVMADFVQRTFDLIVTPMVLGWLELTWQGRCVVTAEFVQRTFNLIVHPWYLDSSSLHGRGDVHELTCGRCGPVS